jgi:plasmid maintenance system antidote protein VapI
MIRLTYDIARQVRARARAGETHKSIAASLDVSVATIGKIVNRVTWKSRDVAIPPETIAKARELLASGEKHDSVAFDLGMSRSYVTQLANGKRRANG